MFTAVFTRHFLRKREKLAGEVRARLIEAVKGALADPYSGVPLSGQFQGLWRIRMGDYRVIYEIDSDGSRIVFHDVDHRGKVYN